MLCTRTIILPCKFIEVSPLNLVFVIRDVCQGHILKSTKGIEMKLGLKIDGSERKDSTHKQLILHCLFT